MRTNSGRQGTLAIDRGHSLMTVRAHHPKQQLARFGAAFAIIVFIGTSSPAAGSESSPADPAESTALREDTAFDARTAGQNPSAVLADAPSQEAINAIVDPVILDNYDVYSE